MSRVSVDLNWGVATVDGVEVKLTPRETEFLYLLTEKLGKPFTKEELIRRIWGHACDLEDEDGAIRQRVIGLRRKLRGTPLKIENRFRFGYRAIFAD